MKIYSSRILLLTLLLFSLVISNSLSGQTISSINPVSGNVGDTVTITGSGFNTTPINNQVRFGATQATVTAATNTQLIVTVPTGATYGPITVKIGILTAYSAQHFTPKFSPIKQTITTGDFDPIVNFNTGSSPRGSAVGDLNGDGKTDIVVANYNSNNISIFQSNATVGSISNASFASPLTLNAGTNPRNVAIGDIDGDGKLDIAVTNYTTNNVSVFRNNATSGTISFASPVNFGIGTGTNPYHLAIRDLDGDGKSDLAITNFTGNKVSVLRNTSVSGTISFAAKVNFTTGSNAYGVAIGDLDGDSKPDMAVVNALSGSVSVFRNTSTPGTISFAGKVDFTVGSSPLFVSICDVDGDGKLDLAASNYSSNTVSILRNTATSGIINYSSFADKVDFAAGTTPFPIGVGDVDGDGKPDLVTGSANGYNTLAVLRNTATPGSITINSFALQVLLTTQQSPTSVVICDLDGDGRSDILASHQDVNSFSVIRNNPNPIQTNAIPSPLASGVSVNVGFTAFWNMNPGNIFTAQLSDSTGNFANAVNIGTLSGVGSDTINAVIPSNTLQGTGYRIRVISSNPVINGIDNGNNIYIYTGQNSLDFDGVNDFVSLGSFNGINQLSSMTIEGWVYLNALPAATLASTIFYEAGSGNNDIGLTVDSEGRIGATLGNGVARYGVTNVPAITTASWTHIAMVYDGTGASNADKLKIYVNGNSQTLTFTNDILSLTPNPTSETAFIGSLRGTEGYLNGKIDELRFWTTARSGTEIVENMNAEVNINSAGLYAYYLFNQGTSCSANPGITTLLDAKSSNPGTLFNFALSGLFSNWQNGFNINPCNHLYAGTIPTPLCSETNVSVPFTAIGIFNAGNTFTAQLSDANGGFGAPTTIGTLSSTTSGIINATIPANTAPGTLYRIRVVSSAPAYTGADNGINIPICIPSITSFSPQSGPVGTSVVITGNNFGDSPINNLVFFGAVKATVTAATATQLTVTVPAGATYAPLTVKVADRTAYSNQYYLTTFSPNKPAITLSDFEPRVDIGGGSRMIHFDIGDLDGDAKPDLVVADLTGDIVSVYRNISNSGSLSNTSFAPKVDFATGAGGPYSVRISDLDGDGKPELIVAEYNENTISVFRNTSTAGSITTQSFAARVTFNSGNGPEFVRVADLDGDGKPELVVANFESNSVSIFKNNSITGNIDVNSFATKVDFPTGDSPGALWLRDLDGDGRLDISVACYNSDVISIFRNTTVNGLINANSFSSKVDIPSGDGPNGIFSGDIDGDGKPDLMITNYNANTVSAFRNTASPGSLTTGSFAARVDFDTGQIGDGQGVDMGDINGDGKPDLVVSNELSNTISIYRNQAVSGNFSSNTFAPKLDLVTGSEPREVRIADLDGDGKSDIISTNEISNTLSLFRNNSNPIITNPVDTIFCAGNSLNISFTTLWNLNAGNVFTAQLSDAAGSFANPVNIGTKTGISSDSLNALIPANTPYGAGYRVRIVSSNPVYISPDNGSNVFINVLPVAATAITGSTTILLGSNYTYSTPAISNTNSYQWSYTGTGVSIFGTGASVIVDYSFAATPGLLQVGGVNSCGTGPLYSIPISLSPNPSFLGFELVKDINSGAGGSNPADLFVMESTLFFSATLESTGRELYKSSGTYDGTGIVKDINPGAANGLSNQFKPTILSSNLIFAATNSASGTELWKSNGTSSGTSIIADFNVGTANTNPRFLTTSNGKVYFNGYVPNGGYELCQSNGNSVTLSADICESNCNGLTANTAIVNIEDELYFGAKSIAYGTEPYVYIPTTTPPSVVQLEDISTLSSYPSGFTQLNNEIYFSAERTDVGKELWKFNINSFSTTLFKNIRPGSASSFPGDLTPAPGIAPNFDALFFTANNGSTGKELWISKFESQGNNLISTSLLKDIQPGLGSSELQGLTYLNGLLFFQADNGINGTELWVSGGTDTTTYMLKDINCGSGDSYPYGFTELNGWVYFGANDGVHGFELWRTDGTTEGTSLVGDLQLGSGGSQPSDLTKMNNILYFNANDGNTGTELWKYNPTSTRSVTAGPSPIHNLCPGTVVPVQYIVNGTFNPGNIFTIQLSDPTGCFNNPINVGTKLANTDGFITATIPNNLAGGNQYRFRIVSSDPPSVPIESPTEDTAKYFPTKPSAIYGNQHVAPLQNGLIYNVPVLPDATLYPWSYTGTGHTISGSGTTITLSFASNATSGNLSCAGFNGCGEGQAAILPIFVSSVMNLTAGRWDTIPTFVNIGRSGAIAMTIGDKGYFGGGKVGNTYLTDFWEYDPILNTWQPKATIPGGARQEAIAFSIGNRGYIGSGYDEINAKSDFWEYNPATNTWAQKSDIPGGGRWSAVGFSIGNKGYVGSGKKGPVSTPSNSNDFYQYDPVANQWIIQNSIPVARFGAVGFSIANLGYIGLGKGDNYMNDFYSFSPATQTWTPQPSFPGIARKDAIGLYMADRGYVGTGNQGSVYFRDFWEFKPGTGWIARQNIGAQGRSLAVAFSIKDELWAGTGSDGTTTLSDFRKFIPSFINDEPQDAVSVPISSGSDCGLSLLGSTNYATQTSPACTAGQFADDDVWYKFTATAAIHVLRLFNFSSPLGFEIFSGTPGNFISIACSPSAGNLFVMNNLNIGEQYYIRVYTVANGLSSDFSICIDSNPVQAVNDECLSATLLPVANTINCTTETYNTSQATQSLPACLVNTIADDDVWFKFVATSNTQLLTVENITPIPTYANSGNLVLELMTGSCNTLTSVTCMEATNNTLFTQIMNGLTIGNTYYIRCYSAANTGYLSFKLCISTAPAGPVNDLCTNAITLPVNPGYFCEQKVSGSTTGASSVWDNNGCTGDDTFDEVWYLFTATSNSHVVSFDNIVMTFGENIAVNQIMGVQLYDASCTESGFIACAGIISNNKYVFNGLIPNNSYRLRVFTKQPGVYANFDICVVTTPPVPGNDPCTSAYTLPINETLECNDFLSGTTYYASYSFVPGGCGPSNSDVWYRFTATQSNYVLTLKNIRGAETGAPGSALSVQLLRGSCNEPIPELCATDSVFFFTGLVSGANYLVRVVLPTNNTIGEEFASFDICLSKTPPAPPNDECSSAILLSVSNQAFCTTAIEGTTEGATRSLPDCSGKVSDDDVWYQFIATGTDQVVSIYSIEKIKGSGAVWFEVFSGGACNSLSSLVCAKEGIQRLNGITVGNTYFIRVFTENSNSYQRFRVCLSTPPLNDVCNSARLLGNPLLDPLVTQGCQHPEEQGSTLGADLSSGDACNLLEARDVWYKFFATSTKHIISVYDIQREIVDETGSNQLQFAVFTGICGDLIPVGCQQSGNFLVVENLVVGQLCHVKVFSPSDRGYSFKICISQEPPIQTNNNCLGAQSVTIDNTGSCPNPIPGSTYTTLSNSNAIEDGCVYSGININGVTWYKFTATSNTHTVKIMDVAGQSGSAAPLYHQVYSGNCATGLSTINCLSDLDSSRYDHLVAGQTYFFKVGKLQSFSGMATFKVCVSATQSTAPNNTCNGSTLLSVNGPLVSDNSSYGTQSMLSCTSDNSANDDLWYRFVATGTQHKVEISNVNPIGGSSVKMVREIFGGSSCQSLFSLYCSEEDFVAEGLVPGTTYYVRAYTKGDNIPATYQIRVLSVGSPPINDACPWAITLPANAALIYAATASGTTFEATQSLTPCLGFEAGDVWYKFTATGGYASLQISPETGYQYSQEIVMEAYFGTCSSLTSFAGCIEGTNTFLAGLTPGNTYFIRVYEKTGLHPFQFNIGLLQYAVNPSNDNCPAAISVPVNASNNCTTILRGTNVAATASVPLECIYGLYCDDVFYQFVATASTHLILLQNISAVTASSMIDSLGFVVYTSCVNGALSSHSKQLF